MDQNAPPGLAGVLDEDENWERIDYFLERVVPVAESNKVRLACHPHDPYTPPGYRGVTRVLGTVEGLKKFVQMRESPYHGLNFCQGTVGEMLDDPRDGDRRRDPLVRHARQDLQRPLPQHQGRQALASWRSSPTRATWTCATRSRSTPRSATNTCSCPTTCRTCSDTSDAQAFAYCFGYIRALLQVLKPEYPEVVEL